MYLGNTGRKKCTLENDIYTGAEGKHVRVKNSVPLKYRLWAAAIVFAILKLKFIWEN